MVMAESSGIRLKIDGGLIKAARDRQNGVHREALVIIEPGKPDRRDWGATITGNAEIRVCRSSIEDKFTIEVISGHFESGCPEPDFDEKWPLKHIYIQQSLRIKQLNALVASCNKTSWYHHDVRIVGEAQIVYDRRWRGFKDMAQLWIQTRGKVINVGSSWEIPVQRKRYMNPAILTDILD